MKEQTRPRKALILGGGYAGMIAAARIARGVRRAAVDVTLLDSKADFVQRIRLHEVLAGREPTVLRAAPLLARRGVRFVEARVEALDPGRRQVTARTAGGERLDLDYDVAVLALGSTTAAGEPGVAEHAVRLDDPRALRQAHGTLVRLAAASGQILVAGGGLTGIETAAEIAERFPALRHPGHPRPGGRRLFKARRGASAPPAGHPRRHPEGGRRDPRGPGRRGGSVHRRCRAVRSLPLVRRLRGATSPARVRARGRRLGPGARRRDAAGRGPSGAVRGRR